MYMKQGKDPVLLAIKEHSSEVSQTQPAAELRLEKLKPFSLRTTEVTELPCCGQSHTAPALFHSRFEIEFFMG